MPHVGSTGSPGANRRERSESEGRGPGKGRAIPPSKRWGQETETISSRRGTEAVITAPTRNRLGALCPTWVRIPPSPPYNEKAPPPAGPFRCAVQGAWTNPPGFDRSAGQPIGDADRREAPRSGRGQGWPRSIPTPGWRCRRRFRIPEAPPTAGPFIYAVQRGGPNPPGSTDRQDSRSATPTDGRRPEGAAARDGRRQSRAHGTASHSRNRPPRWPIVGASGPMVPAGVARRTITAEHLSAVPRRARPAYVEPFGRVGRSCRSEAKAMPAETR